MSEWQAFSNALLHLNSNMEILMLWMKPEELEATDQA